MISVISNVINYPIKICTSADTGFNEKRVKVGNCYAVLQLVPIDVECALSFKCMIIKSM